mgnify:FL=1
MSTNTARTTTRTARTSGAPKTLLTPAGFFDNFTVSSWLHRYDAPAVFFCVMPGACARPVVGGARRRELFADQTGYLFCDGAEQAYPARCVALGGRCV